MATREYLTERKGYAVLNDWGTLNAGDDGSWLPVWAFKDRTVQVTGVFGGGSIVWEGSLDLAATKTAFTLHDPQNNALSFSSAGMSVVLENALYIRPRVVGGNGTTALIPKLSGIQ